MEINKKHFSVVVYLVGLFIIDINLPFTISIGVLYLLTHLMIYRLNSKAVLYLSSLIIVIALIKPIVYILNHNELTHIINRVLVILSLFITSFFSYKNCKEREARIRERLLYINNIEQMLFKSNDEVRAQLIRVLGIMDALKKEESNDTNQVKVLIGYLQNSAVELDYFVRSFNEFTSKIKRNEINKT